MLARERFFYHKSGVRSSRARTRRLHFAPMPGMLVA